jgi:hypothetical protein
MYCFILLGGLRMNKRSLLSLILFLSIANTALITPAQALRISTLVKYKWPALHIIAGIAFLSFLKKSIKDERLELILGTSHIFFDNQESGPINLLPTVAGITLIGLGIKRLIT